MSDRSRARSVVVPAALLVLGLALGGCAAGEGTADPDPVMPSSAATAPAAPSTSASSAPASPSPSVSPSVSPSADPSGSPSATETFRPDAASLVVSTAGLGPLVLGRPVEGSEAESMVRSELTECGEVWFSVYDEDRNAHDEPAPLFFVEEQPDLGGVVWIDLLGRTPRTAEGIGVGSTLEEVRAAYPDLEGPFEGPISRTWWVEDAAGIMAFETELPSATGGTADEPERVELVHLLATGSSPAFTSAHTDLVPGSCS